MEGLQPIVGDTTLETSGEQGRLRSDTITTYLHELA
jgi:hypothetical protein